MTSRNKNVTRLATKPQKIHPPANGAPFRLRIAGALQPREEGFIGIDSVKTDSVDYMVDLKKFPLPIDSNTVDTIFTAHYLQKLDGQERIHFMNEMGRILKIGAQLILVAPYWSSMRAVSDPTAKWPPLCDASFVFFNKEWREHEHIDYGITCDFDFGVGYGMDQDVQVKNAEYQQFAFKHYVNSILDLHATLTRKT